MKVKNIMFSGIMAAILMTVAGGANAAEPVAVASTGYVDAKVGAVSTLVGETTVEQQISTAIENYNTTVEADLSGKADKATTLAGYGIEDAYTKTAADEKFMIMNNADALGGNLQWKDGKLDTKDIATADGLNQLTDTVDELSGVVNGGAETEGTVANKIAAAVKTLEDGQVKTNKEAIDVLNGDATTAGSVAKAIADAQSELQGNIDAKVSQTVYDAHLTAQTTIDTKQTEDIAANAAAIEALDGTYVSDTAFGEFQAANTDAIADAKKAGTDAAAAVKTLEEGQVATNTAAIATKQDIIVAGTNVEIAEDGKTINVAGTGTAAAGDAGLVSGGTLYGYAVPKPGADCDKTTCVLSVNQEDGKPYWMQLALTVSE